MITIFIIPKYIRCIFKRKVNTLNDMGYNTVNNSNVTIYIYNKNIIILL